MQSYCRVWGGKLINWRYCRAGRAWWQRLTHPAVESVLPVLIEQPVRAHEGVQWLQDCPLAGVRSLRTGHSAYLLEVALEAQPPLLDELCSHVAH